MFQMGFFSFAECLDGLDERQDITLHGYDLCRTELTTLLCVKQITHLSVQQLEYRHIAPNPAQTDYMFGDYPSE